MKVEVYCYNHDQKDHRLCETWTLDEKGHAICTNDFEQKSMEMHGFSFEGRRYYPKDGKDFLRHLPWDYAFSTFVRATLVE
ncbi:hypothetical protein [Prosthecobacter sp.]|uniref:hypothetical protein n=1 Tax=Prosthecobacter sp. TaxID=1965333 RepID=UPI003784D1FC